MPIQHNIFKQMILGGLTAMMRDNNSDDQDMYKDMQLEELLVCVTDGLFKTSAKQSRFFLFST